MKIPSPDGFTNELYQTLKQEVTPALGKQRGSHLTPLVRPAQY